MLPDTTELTTRENRTARMEAFSDGVFSIAITLLVFQIEVPRNLPEDILLGQALVDLWPSFFAFVTSFATIGIMWINHHNLFKLINRTDPVLLILNTLLLMMVTFINFPTALLGAYINSVNEHVTAGVIYTGTFAVTAIVFNLLWRYASYKHRLMDESADATIVRDVTRSYNLGLILYWLAFALAFVATIPAIVLNFVLAVFFALPIRSRLFTSGSVRGLYER